MLKLNVNRTFKALVPLLILTETGEQVEGEFSATFKVMNLEQAKDEGDNPLLDVVLDDVHDIELTDASGQVLTGQALLKAAKNDPTISTALVTSYWENVVKKPQSKT